MMKSVVYDSLRVEIHDDRKSMGNSAAERTAGLIRAVAGRKGSVNMIFAAAPSQNDLLAALCGMSDIPWDKVNALHMDEYLGLGSDAPQRFANYLKEHLFNHVECREVNFIDTAASDSDSEIGRYSDLLKKYPPDIVCLGIGENGHIAFNDPPVADFKDPALVKAIELDEVSRIQQVHDGCFDSLDKVPRRALTLTVPALFSGVNMVCVVPTKYKAEAVRRMLTGEISTECPASILRNHSSATLYLDNESSALL